MGPRPALSRESGASDWELRATPLPARIFLGILVDPNSPCLDDPEMASDRWLERSGERVDGVLEMPEGGFRRQAQDGDAREVCGAVTKRIAELEIESDQAPPFLT